MHNGSTTNPRRRRKLRAGAEELRPRGYPGMAEAGNMPLPPKVLRKGITDMVRISDARMSGTAYGTVVLHVTPKPPPAAAGAGAERRHGRTRCGGPQAAPACIDEELAPPCAWQPPAPPMERGWTRLYFDHVQQANRGADLDFLVGKSGAAVPKDNH
jgi:dihydroxy-acid dehydratase